MAGGPAQGGGADVPGKDVSKSCQSFSTPMANSTMFISRYLLVKQEAIYIIVPLYSKKRKLEDGIPIFRKKLRKHGETWSIVEETEVSSTLLMTMN